MSTSLKEHAKLIKTLPGFSKLDRKDIYEMLKQKEVLSTMSYEPGEFIIKEKALDRRIFLVIKGEVAISKTVITGDCKHEKELKTVEGHGLFLGEMSAITGKPRTATVTAVTPTFCVIIDMAKLMTASSSLVERVKMKFYPKLFELLCKRLEETNENVVLYQQRYEDLQCKLMEEKKARLVLKKEQQEEIYRKNWKIKTLEDEIEGLKGGGIS